MSVHPLPPPPPRAFVRLTHHDGRALHVRREAVVAVSDGFDDEGCIVHLKGSTHLVPVQGTVPDVLARLLA